MHAVVIDLGGLTERQAVFRASAVVARGEDRDRSSATALRETDEVLPWTGMSWVPTAVLHEPLPPRRLAAGCAAANPPVR